MWIDTHAHLYVSAFDEDRSEVINRAFEAGIDKIILPNIDRESIPSLIQLSKEFPDQLYPALGLHPCSVDENYRQELESIYSEIEKNEVVAIGEIGLDLYWDKSSQEIQLLALKEQVDWALKLDLPIIIHARESLEELIEFFSELPNRPKGVFHCFTGNIDQAQRIISLGFHLGIGGVATFKNSSVDQVVKEIPLEKIMLETDAPYLSPTPYRGKRNESAYVELVGKYLANSIGVSFEDLAKITSENAKRLFSI